MEISRNIVKAIDALTEKAGGEKVDSANINEAIDNLRLVYNQSAISVAEVNRLIGEYLTAHPVSPQTIANTVNTYLQNNPIDISSVVLATSDDGNGNVTLRVNTN